MHLGIVWQALSAIVMPAHSNPQKTSPGAIPSVHKPFLVHSSTFAICAADAHDLYQKSGDPFANSAQIPFQEKPVNK
jgi:hypothetical protein